MISRERVGRALRHERPDRVPIYESFWEATTNRWREEGLPAEMSPDDHFGTEIRLVPVDNSFGFAPEESANAGWTRYANSAAGSSATRTLDHSCSAQ